MPVTSGFCLVGCDAGGHRVRAPIPYELEGRPG
jgi:hypothetical protein